MFIKKEKLKTKQIRVFVTDAEGKPLLPTTPRRARKLLDSGKAKVVQVMPFTIQLKRIVDDPVGSFEIGIDDGAKKVGVAIINKYNKEVVFKGEIELRQDVSRKLRQRAMYRRNRRSRNLRYRVPRFKNRTHFTPLPSVKQRKDSIIRFVKDMLKRINITRAVIEEGMFDVASMVAGKKLFGIWKSRFEGESFRAKVLWRDKYICQRPGCKSKKSLQAHHIIPKKDGGTNRVKNGTTLCRDCHESLHREEWILEKKKPRSFRYPMFLMQGKYYLREEFIKLGIGGGIAYGWMTNQWRKKIGLEKSHSNDAIAMICKNYLPKISSLDWLIKPRRTKIWENNPTRTCNEKNGFRHYDIVKSHNRNKEIIIGSVLALGAKQLALRTSFGKNFGASYNKAKLIQRPSGLVYIT